MKICTMVEASVRWRSDGWAMGSRATFGEVYPELILSWSGSTTPAGNALRTLSCSSVERSQGRARKR